MPSMETRIAELIKELDDSRFDQDEVVVDWRNGDVPIMLIGLQLLKRVIDGQDTRALTIVEAERKRLGV